ncbi:MAG: hypothetical protein R3E34_07010 [Rhodocyclaceae bacterium]
MTAVLLFANASAPAAQLAAQRWPAPSPCEACVVLQYGSLSMRLPLSRVGRIYMSGGEDGALHLLPASDRPEQGVVLLAVDTADYLKTYRSAGLLDDMNHGSMIRFLDDLGVSRDDDEGHVKLREAEGVSAARHYSRFSKDTVSVYWIGPDLTSAQWQRAFFVVEGESVFYTLSGNITPELIAQILSNLTVTPQP